MLPRPDLVCRSFTRRQSNAEFWLSPPLCKLARSYDRKLAIDIYAIRHVRYRVGARQPTHVRRYLDGQCQLTYEYEAGSSVILDARSFRQPINSRILYSTCPANVTLCDAPRPKVRKNRTCSCVSKSPSFNRSYLHGSISINRMFRPPAAVLRGVSSTLSDEKVDELHVQLWPPTSSTNGLPLQALCYASSRRS